MKTITLIIGGLAFGLATATAHADPTPEGECNYSGLFGVSTAADAGAGNPNTPALTARGTALPGRALDAGTGNDGEIAATLFNFVSMGYQSIFLWKISFG